MFFSPFRFVELVADIVNATKCSRNELEVPILTHGEVLGNVSVLIELVAVGKSVGHNTTMFKRVRKSRPVSQETSYAFT